MTTKVTFDQRLVKPDLSNVVLSRTSTRVVRIEYFPNASSGTRKILIVTDVGDVFLVRQDGYNPDGPNVCIELDEGQDATKIYVVEHIVTGIRSITTDASLFAGDDVAYKEITSYTVNHYR